MIREIDTQLITDNVQEMKNKNYEVWKKVYEEAYGIPLTYTCDEKTE
jgi:hypothetical protein